MWASQEAQCVKNPPAMQEMWVHSLGQEGPLEEGMATHCSNPAWRIPWTEEPGGLQSKGLQRAGHIRSNCVHRHTHTRLVIVVLPRSKRLLISWLQSEC